MYNKYTFSDDIDCKTLLDSALTQYCKGCRSRNKYLISISCRWSV